MAAWTYSDWDTGYTDGSAEQLARLKLHVKEVADAIRGGSTSTEGKSHDVDPLLNYLKLLEERRDALAAAVSTSAGTRSAFTRGRAI